MQTDPVDLNPGYSNGLDKPLSEQTIDPNRIESESSHRTIDPDISDRTIDPDAYILLLLAFCIVYGTLIFRCHIFPRNSSHM